MLIKTLQQPQLRFQRASLISAEYLLCYREGFRLFLRQRTRIHMLQLRDNIAYVRGCKNEFKGSLCFVGALGGKELIERLGKSLVGIETP
ncbi:MAG TPA: hypothetical protein VF393_03690 [archaeon]